jgi:magnesium-protoporphyrin O-methyltransferase
LKAARENAEQMGIGDKVEYQHLDFAVNPNELKAADVVLMDRVVCCYPDLEGLLIPAASKSKQYFVLSYPREGLWVRLDHLLNVAIKWITRSPFRIYYHEPKHIRELLMNEGMDLVDEATEEDWQIDVYKKK